MALCKGCGRPIRWIGKIPCDTELVMYWQRAKAPGKIVTPDGEIISCVFEGKPEAATGYGYRTHWETCPDAERFRRKAPAREGEEQSVMAGME